MDSRQQHYLCSCILSSKALCQQCYWKRTVLILAHINVSQRFPRWLLGYLWGEVQFVRHRCSTMMTTAVNEVSQTSSKKINILPPQLRGEAPCISCFYQVVGRAEILLYLSSRKCLSPPPVNILSASLAPSHHINMHREIIDIFLSGPPG